MIRFRDLSNPLKAAIIAAWIVGTVYFIALCVGFIIGLTGGV